MRHLVIILSFFIVSWTQASDRIRVTTFNIEWYGLGGEMNGTEEHRDPTIRTFLREHVPPTDVFVFQEIVDVPRFQAQQMGKNYRCTSYRHDDEKHQFVLICVRKGLRLDREIGFKTFRFDPITLESPFLRPAVFGILKTSHGRPLLRVMGVHLKAHALSTDRRLDQVRTVADLYRQLPQDLPQLVVGDFNSHRTPLNEKEKDDKDLMQEVFDLKKSGLILLPNLGETYRNAEKEKSHQLDQAFLASPAKFLTEARVSGPCNPGSGEGEFHEIEFYNRWVSDHCPVSFVLEIP